MNHPITDQIHNMIRNDPRTIKQIARAAGLDPRTMYDWGKRVQPKIHNIEAVLTVLGYRLVICDLTNPDTTD